MRPMLIASFLLWGGLSLSAQNTYAPRPRNQAVSLSGIVLTSPKDKLNTIGLVSLNYERSFISFPSRRLRIGVAGGITPPLADDIDFAFHLGPKIYKGGPTSWFCADIQYWGLLSTAHYVSNGKSKPYTAFEKVVTLGVGYCYTGPKGFFFNPEVLIGGYTPDKTHLQFGESDRSTLFAGASLGVGYCF